MGVSGACGFGREGEKGGDALVVSHVRAIVDGDAGVRKLITEGCRVLKQVRKRLSGGAKGDCVSLVHEKKGFLHMSLSHPFLSDASKSSALANALSDCVSDEIPISMTFEAHPTRLKVFSGSSDNIKDNDKGEERQSDGTTKAKSDTVFLVLESQASTPVKTVLSSVSDLLVDTLPSHGSAIRPYFDTDRLHVSLLSMPVRYQPVLESIVSQLEALPWPRRRVEIDINRLELRCGTDRYAI
ncbi:hypothetical protein KIPB_001241 [Kipferlia bialata]|uniref:U6 snRNA phosphodiesterase n=1 Tax=Kipferlia bialata TaxID=797122 RepID=A0A9K3GFR9_9EUKA|nr:hypothetical protein KIPB_001241 [Kipferlia bialata]|eukprot:g1241.t1